MRLLCLLFLLVVIGGGAVFAAQNRQEVLLSFYDWNRSVPLPALIGGVYLLGMLTGWSVVGLLRRSFERATDLNDGYAARTR